MKKLLVLILMVSLTASCSMLTAGLTKMLNSGQGIRAEAQIGDREGEAQIGGARGAGKIEVDEGNVSVSNTQTSSKIDRAETVNIENIPIWVALLLILGWVLPTPTSMIKGFKQWLQAIRRPQLRKDSGQKPK